MRRLALMLVLGVAVAWPAPARAQGPPPPLPRLVVDLHGVVPLFPNDSPQLADSRGLTSITELPGPGLGGRIGAHLYLFTWKAVTIGVGFEALVARSRSTPDPQAGAGLAAVDERLTTYAPQLSFNFGSGRGWSYLSGGVGRTRWSIHPSGQPEGPADAESLPTVNYGGGARWFIKRHLAFSLDVRIYEIQPGTPVPPAAGSPRTRLFVIGAGVSLK